MTGVDDARTYTWIADAGSAKAAARSFARGNVRRRRWVFLVLWLLAGALMWASLEDGLAPVERVLWHWRTPRSWSRAPSRSAS